MAFDQLWSKVGLTNYRLITSLTTLALRKKSSESMFINKFYKSPWKLLSGYIILEKSKKRMWPIKCLNADDWPWRHQPKYTFLNSSSSTVKSFTCLSYPVKQSVNDIHIHTSCTYYRWYTRGSLFCSGKVFEGVHSHVISLLRKSYFAPLNFLFENYDHMCKSEFGNSDCKIGNSNYWKVEQNRNWTCDYKFRREIVWSKIGFSNKVHHVRMNSFKHFSGAKKGPPRTLPHGSPNKS